MFSQQTVDCYRRVSSRLHRVRQFFILPAPPDPGEISPAGRRLRLAGYAACFLLAALLLTLGIYANTWHAAQPEWFAVHQLDSETSVIGRMVESRAHGPFSHHLLLCRQVGFQTNPQWLKDQYDLFFQGRTDVPSTDIYFSQIGLQGLAFSLLDRLFAGVDSRLKLESFRLLLSVLLALVLSGILLWMLREFGAVAWLAALGVLLFSPWVTALGRNLYWVFWIYYLPLLTVLIAFALDERREKPRYLLLAVTLTVILFLKCASGYEYITAIIVSLYVPLAYYALKRRYAAGTVLRYAAAITGAVVIAVPATLGVHLLLLSRERPGGLAAAVGVIQNRIQIRTTAYGDMRGVPVYFQDSLRVRPREVIANYLHDAGIGTNIAAIFMPDQPTHPPVSVPYLVVVRVFFAGSCLLGLLLPLWWRHAGQRWKVIALLAATWLSILAPLSWFVIFKGHSYIHRHINNVLWHLPFVLLGCALTGYALHLLATTGRLVWENARQANSVDEIE